MRFPVLDRSDAEALAREPGEQWYSGVEAEPPHLLGAPATGSVVRRAQTTGRVGEVLDGVRLGQEPGIDEIVTLFSARGPEVAAVAEVADELRQKIVGDVVTFVAQPQHQLHERVHVQVQVLRVLQGTAVAQPPGQRRTSSSSTRSPRRVAEAEELGATEVCLQGGIHPSFDGDYYIDVIKAVQEASQTIHMHGFTALEVTEGAKRLGEPLADYLRRLMDAGLKTLPGTAAEILDDEIRAILCPDKVNTEEWLDAHRTAHSVGLRSNITIMFGSIEQPVHWARHLVRTRDLQNETGGFTEFVPLPFVHMASPIYLQHKAGEGRRSARRCSCTPSAASPTASSSPNIQVSWVKIGVAGARQILQAGANDLGGTLMDENISRAAGAAHGQLMDEAGFHEIVDPLGRPLEQRTTLYGRVPTPA